MSPTDPAFPEQLSDAADRPRVVETFGLGPSLLAFALAAYGASALAGSWQRGLDATEVAVLALIFAASAGCVRHEVRRRRLRAVLVAAGDGVGVYREGRLSGVLTRRDLKAIRAPEPVPLKLILVLPFLAAGFLFYGASQQGGLLSRAADMTPGFVLALFTVSLFRTAFLCEALRLPGSRSRMLFSKTGLADARVAP